MKKIDNSDNPVKNDEIQEYFGKKLYHSATVITPARVIFTLLLLCAIGFMFYFIATDNTDFSKFFKGKQSGVYREMTVEEMYKDIDKHNNDLKQYNEMYVIVTGRKLQIKQYTIILTALSGSSKYPETRINTVTDKAKAKLKGIPLGAKVSAKGQIVSADPVEGVTIDATDIEISV